MNFKDLFDTYFKYVGVNEIPSVYHRWTLISLVSTLLGRRVWTHYGHKKVTPMQFIIFVGNPGDGKSTAIKVYGKPLLRAIGYNYLAPTRTSKEMLWEDLANGDIGPQEEGGSNVVDIDKVAGEDIPKECAIWADELVDFFGGGDIEGFCTNLGSLWDWDDGDFTVRNKNSKSIAIWQPTINLLGGITPYKLTKVFGEHAIGSGFFSRIIFIKAPRKKDKIRPEEVTKKDKELFNVLVSHLQEVSCLMGEMKISNSARVLIGDIYQNTPKMGDWRFDYYQSRRHEHILKLLCAIGCMKGDNSITEEDVIFANTIMHSAELYMPAALGEFGAAKSADKSQILLDAIIKSTREETTLEQLFKKIGTSMESLSQMWQLANKLEAMGKVRKLRDTETNKVLILPIIEVTNQWPDGFIDYSLLTDEEDPNRGFSK